MFSTENISYWTLKEEPNNIEIIRIQIKNYLLAVK